MNTQYELSIKDEGYGPVVQLKAEPYDMSPAGVKLRAADGWLKNTGKAPAANGASCDVIYRNGESSGRCRIGKSFDGATDWTVSGDPRDIVEYKMLGNGIFA